MGRLSRGILGSISGKLGKYTLIVRNKKNIIKTTSLPKDNYKRSIPLVKFKLQSEFLQFWNIMTAQEQQAWNNIAPVGQSGRDLFVNSNIENAVINRQNDTIGARFQPPTGLDYLNLRATGSWIQGYFIFNVPDDLSFYEEPGDKWFELILLRINKSYKKVTVRLAQPFPDQIFYDFSALQDIETIQLYFRLMSRAPNVESSYFITDLGNLIQ